MVIRGIGVVGGFGIGNAALARALEQGDIQDAAARGAPVRVDAAAVQDALARHVDKRKLRRLDLFSRMAALAAFLALEDAGLAGQNCEALPVIVATGYGPAQTTFEFLDSLIDHGDRLASPTLFSHSVHNAAAANIALLLGATGPSLTVSQFDRPFASALRTAQAWLVEGRIESALVGGVDAYCEVLGYCWKRMREERGPGEAPGEAPGEGAAFFLLGKEGDRRYGRVADAQTSAASQESPLLRVCGSFPAREALELAVAASLRALPGLATSKNVHYF